MSSQIPQRPVLSRSAARPSAHRAIAGLAAVLAAALPVRAQERAADAGGWDSPAALDLAARAIEARSYAYADSSLDRFTAHVQGHVYFVGEFRREREVVRADQIALQVYWQAPDRSLQMIVGRRHDIRLPTNIKYHLDHLSLVLDNFGDGIRLGNGDEVWDVEHPAARGAPGRYQYRLADSLEIRSRDRTARVYRLDVRPRDPDRPAVVGSMFVDRESGAIARLRLTFTPASYRDPNLESISLDLRSGLWEGGYWLPSEQHLEIRRSLSWLDFPLESVIRTRLEVLEYDFGDGGAFPLGPGHRVASLPADDLERYWRWETPLYGGPLEPEERSDDDLAEALADARSLLSSPRLLGGERLQLALPDASSAFRARRAEGLFMGGGGRLRIDDLTGTSFWGGYAMGGERIEARAALERDLGRGWDARLEGYFRSLRDVGLGPAASGVVQTLGLVFEGEDYGDPYFEDGGRAAVGRDLGRGRVEAGISVRRQRSADLVMSTVVLGDRPLRPVRPVDDGELVAFDSRLEVPLGRALGAGWRVELAGEAATAAIGSFGFTRGILRLAGRREPLGAGWGWSSELTLGVAGGDLPAQRLFLLGGRGTLPGYEFRSWGGDRVALWQGEVSRGLIDPWVRLRALGAVGWTGLTDVGADAAARFGALQTHGARASAGVGLGLFYDLLRVELVRGLEGRAPGDPRGGVWALMLSLDPMLWEIL